MTDLERKNIIREVKDKVVNNVNQFNIALRKRYANDITDKGMTIATVFFGLWFTYLSNNPNFIYKVINSFLSSFFMCLFLIIIEIILRGKKDPVSLLDSPVDAAEWASSQRHSEVSLLLIKDSDQVIEDLYDSLKGDYTIAGLKNKMESALLDSLKTATILENVKYRDDNCLTVVKKE